MLPVLQIGPLAVQTPLLLSLLGLWLAMTVGARLAKRFEMESQALDDMVLISILAGLIGGRLLYILRFPKAFLENPTGALSINPELFLPTGGLLIGGIAFLILVQRRKLPLLRVLDALSIPAAIFAVFLGLSHLASGSFYGIATDLPIGIELWGASRFPFQILEILAAGLAAGLTWRRLASSSQQTEEGTDGDLFLYWAAVTALVWIVIDPLRADAALLFGRVHSTQLGALLVLAMIFWFWNRGGHPVMEKEI